MRKGPKCHSGVLGCPAMAPHVLDLRPVTERSATQLGLVTGDQLPPLGVRRQARRPRAARGALERLGATVWRLPGHPPSLHQALLAAVLEAGPDAAVSHMSAGAGGRFARTRP